MSDIAGRIRPIPPSLRYVVLRHEGIEHPHFDLMFETKPGSALLTFRSDQWPIETSARVIQLDDHRREYLKYEGPLSEDRGHVRRVTAGVYRLEHRGEDRFRMTFRDTLGYCQLEFNRTTEGWTATPGGSR